MNKIALRMAAAAVLCGMTAVTTMTTASAADLAAGKALVEKYNCASCHGKDFNTSTDPAYPKLAGQHEDYLRHALVAYRRGDSAMNGRTNPIMAGQAKPLSDQDINNIAAYLHSLPGSLVIRK